MRVAQHDHLVLIVTDRPADWLPLELHLQDAGFKTGVLPFPESAATIEKLPADLIIIDHPHSGSSGLAYYREINSSAGRKVIPALLVISPAESDIVAQFFSDEQLDIVSRPVQACMLTHRLHTLLGGDKWCRARGAEMADRLLLLKEAVDSLPMGVTLSDTKGKIIYANKTEALMHGYAVEELIGMKAGEFAKPSMRKPFVPKNMEAIEIWKRDSANLRKDGSEFPVQLTSIAVRRGGRCVGIVTTCEDISVRKEVERRIYQLAHIDSLTGLPNRRLFQDRLQHALALARREDGRVCLAYLDLDNFKEINDTHGHDFGDRLLQEVASRLSAIMRESDTLARMGGDEFVVILVSVKGQDNFTTAAQRLISVFEPPFDIEGRQIYTTASIGIAIFPDDGLHGELLLKCADAAMYQVKREGRSGFRFFSAEMNEKIRRRVTMETALRSGLDNGEFFLLYQPQWSTREKRIIGAEALLRWQGSEFGLMLPAEFLSLVEDSGIIFRIGEWVLRSACLQAKQWQSAGLDGLRVSVNISGKQLNQPDFLAVVGRILEETGVDPGGIELDLAESIVLEHAEKAIGIMHELKALGLQLSIDNFGTGYSSLNYLKNFPINRIKVDRSLIADLRPGSEAAAIFTSIITITAVLKIGVTAEGVETEVQQQCLEELGCMEMQGFLLGMPMTAGELEEKVPGDSSPPGMTTLAAALPAPRECGDGPARSGPCR